MKTKNIIVAALLTLVAGTFSATALAEGQDRTNSHESQSDNQGTKYVPPPVQPSNTNDDGSRSVPDPVGPSVDLPTVPSSDD